MREVVISVVCDACGQGFYETTEGYNSVVLTVRGERREIDLCDDCIHGSFLQEARPVNTTVRKTKGKFPCGCGKSFDTERGRAAHSTRAHSG